jgi:hypothetical protein
LEAHVEHLCQVLRWLRQDQWQLKLQSVHLLASPFINWDM